MEYREYVKIADRPVLTGFAAPALAPHPCRASAANTPSNEKKRDIGRGDFQVDARVLRRGLLDNGYGELPVTSEHAVAIDALPPIHRDPFDRILIAQALVEGITLVTADDIVARYVGPIRRV